MAHNTWKRITSENFELQLKDSKDSEEETYDLILPIKPLRVLTDKNICLFL